MPTKKERIIKMLENDEVMRPGIEYTANILAFQLNLLLSGTISVSAREVSHLLMKGGVEGIEVIKQTNDCDIYVRQRKK